MPEGKVLYCTLPEHPNINYRTRAISAPGALFSIFTDGAVFKRGNYFFIAGTFASSSIKQRKTEPKVYCKRSRLHRNGNKTCDFVPENKSAKKWPRTLAKEHQTCTWAWLQDRGGGGGGGTIQERALFFTGSWRQGHYSR